jgi:hypothetical protein
LHWNRNHVSILAKSIYIYTAISSWFQIHRNYILVGKNTKAFEFWVHLTFIFHVQQKEVKVHKFAPCNITEIPVVQFNTSTLVVTGGKNILTFVGYWNITQDLISPLNVNINQWRLCRYFGITSNHGCQVKSCHCHLVNFFHFRTKFLWSKKKIFLKYYTIQNCFLRDLSSIFFHIFSAAYHD